MTAPAPHPKPLRVLIVGLNYAPEPIGIAAYTTGLTEYFARVGHRVEVIAGRPYYPQWRVYPGFEALAWNRSSVFQTPVRHRVPAAANARSLTGDAPYPSLTLWAPARR